MQTVFAPGPEEGHQWAVPVGTASFERLRALSDRPIASSWDGMAVELLTTDSEGRSRKYADLPWLSETALVLRPPAVDALGPLLAADAELLPLSCEDAELHLLHVWRTVDAVDEARSMIARFSDGRILDIQQPTFDLAQLDGVSAFRLPDYGQVYVTERVARAAMRAGLSGTLFRRVFPRESDVTLPDAD